MPIDDGAGDWKQWSQYVIKQIEETNEQIKNIHEVLKIQNDTLIINTQDLKDHMARTEQVEETNKILAQKMDAIEKEKIEKIAVAQYKNDIAVLVTKIFGGIGFIAGVVYSIFQIIDYLMNLKK
jgi:hypothetical protein